MTEIDLTNLLDSPSQVARQSHPVIHGRQSLYFDIETVPDFSREELFDLDPLPGQLPETPIEDLLSGAEFVSQTLKEMQQTAKKINPVEEWIDEVIAAEQGTGKKFRAGVKDLIDEMRSRGNVVAKAIVARNKKMSVTPEMLQVVAIGMAIGDGEVFGCCTDNETAMLDDFWSIVADCHPVIGFNVLGFDLPAIFARSVLLGITSTRKFDMRPWGRDVIDLMYQRFPKSNATGLKPLARMYGIEIPQDDVDGSQVLELWQAGERDKIEKYVKSDVEITRHLHQMWSGYFC